MVKQQALTDNPEVILTPCSSILLVKLIQHHTHHADDGANGPYPPENHSRDGEPSTGDSSFAAIDVTQAIQSQEERRQSRHAKQRQPQRAQQKAGKGLGAMRVLLAVSFMRHHPRVIVAPPAVIIR